jgi:hypothetical protein
VIRKHPVRPELREVIDDKPHERVPQHSEGPRSSDGAHQESIHGDERCYQLGPHYGCKERRTEATPRTVLISQATGCSEPLALS